MNSSVRAGRVLPPDRLARLLPLAAALCACSAQAAAAQFAVQSLNAPDPIFVTAGTTVPISVTSSSAPALARAVVKLNGRNVTASLAPGADGQLTGTLSGLMAGINSVEVYASKLSKTPAAKLKIAKAIAPATACTMDTFAHAVLPVSNTVITSVTAVAATSSVPAHCLISGTVDAGRVGYPSSPTAAPSIYTYAINWQVRLPDLWNSKYYHPGGGGLDGSVPSTTGNLSLGYAEGADDSGHSNNVNNDPNASGTGSFATDFQARTDFAYRAIDVTSQTAKALIRTYYTKLPDYSYFQGCSQGGREALMVTQWLPDAFDGSIAGDPGLRLATMTTQPVYDAQMLSNLANEMGLVAASGAPLAANTFTNQDLQLVSKAILDACDALDGVVDGMVGNYHRCTTRVVQPKLEALACPVGKTPTCLLPGQIDAIEKIYAGPPSMKPDGTPTYFGWMWDAGIAGCTSAADCNTPDATNIATGWRSWKIGTYQTNPATAANNALDFTGSAGGAMLTAFGPTPPHAAPIANEGVFKEILTYDLNTYAQEIYATTSAFPVSTVALVDVDSPDRSAFRNRGGKLMIYQPQSGGPFSPLSMLDWYGKLNAFEGGTAHNFRPAQKFARLFMMPGAQHCGGGPSTSTINPFPQLVDWVENGNAPESILGTAPSATPWPGRTRPLCMYPAYPRYNGSGDVNVASSFTCTTDPR